MYVMFVEGQNYSLSITIITKEIVSSQICLLIFHHQKMLLYCSLWQEKFQRIVIVQLTVGQHCSWCNSGWLQLGDTVTYIN